MIRAWFLSLFSTLAFWGNTQNLSKQEINEIAASVGAFMSAVRNYSNCQCVGTQLLNHVADITDLHDGSDLRDLMFNDLFTASISGDKMDDYFQTWDSYLEKIRTDFKNEIRVEFNSKNISVLNCIVTDRGKGFVFVTVDKTLFYKDRPNMIYTLLLSINIQNHKIKEVTSPRLYQGNCNIGTDNTEVSKEIAILRNLANDYFSKRDYLNAKSLYSSLLNKLPTDLTAKNNLQECEKFLSYQNLIEKAQMLMRTKKFEDANIVFREALDNFPENKTELESKIAFCNEQLKIEASNKSIEMGDYYYRVANYEEARRYYTNALSFKPNDVSTLQKIENSKKSDRSFVLQEIARAVRLAEASKKNYGEAFKIMSEYEQSRLLTTENYYFLAVMMFKNNRDVKKEMGYSNEDCSNYLNIFVKKLKDKAANERDYEMREKANFLFDEVINQRYQK